MAKILLVDDEISLLELYTLTFVNEGFSVNTAADGKEAIEKAKKFQPDIILLDIMMPVMNGLDALIALKNDPQTRNIIVVVATNLSDQIEEKKAIEAGALKYILKSDYVPSQLVALVKKSLEVPKASSFQEVHAS